MTNVFNKPSTKKTTFSILVKRYFTDIDGALIDKAAAPAVMQTDYPFFMLADFDRAGAYKQGIALLPPSNGVVYLCSFVYGVGLLPEGIQFNPNEQISGNLLLGDIVHLFADDRQSPTAFCWIVQTSQTVSVASVIGNTETEQDDKIIGRLYCNGFQYATDNQNQWDENLVLYTLDNLGDYKKNDLGNYVFKSPFIPNSQTQVIELEVKFPINQFIGLATYFAFDTDTIKFNFKIKR
jgi:hypothetical protein